MHSSYSNGRRGDSTSPIVLVKLDKPVRFSPLNRPVCLPLISTTTGNSNRTSGSDNLFTDCVTASLHLDNTNNPNQDLALRKARLLNPSSCSEGFEDTKDSLCVDEITTSSQTDMQQDITKVLICSTGSGGGGQSQTANRLR